MLTVPSYIDDYVYMNDKADLGQRRTLDLPVGAIMGHVWCSPSLACKEALRCSVAQSLGATDVA